jgi:predicted RecA/RadA family phage recombinase
MQATYIQCGERIDYTPSSAVAAGQVIANEGRVVIATSPIAANVLGAVVTEGLFDTAKVTGAINFLAALYWDADANPLGGVAGTGALTTSAGGNTFAGFAAAAALETDTTVKLLLVGVPAVTNTIHNALTDVLADPGAAGAIPVTDSGHVDIVTVAAETRTLAAPTNVGQMLLISMKTDGGDCVITCATTVNQTGNNTITLNDAGDAILLVAKINGTNKRWSVVSNDGCTLATV